MLLQRHDHVNHVQSIYDGSKSSENEDILEVYSHARTPETYNYQPLFVNSTFFRSLLSSIPCCTKPHLILPDVDLVDLNRFMLLISDGMTDLVSTAEEVSAVIEVAQMFKINASNYSVLDNDESQNHPPSNKLPSSNSKKEDNRSDNVCQICGKDVEKKRMMSHYTFHFKEEILTKCSDIINITSKTCSLCGRRFRKQNLLIEHMGMVHKKINGILVDKGLRPIEDKQLVTAFKTCLEEDDEGKVDEPIELETAIHQPDDSVKGNEELLLGYDAMNNESELVLDCEVMSSALENDIKSEVRQEITPIEADLLKEQQYITMLQTEDYITDTSSSDTINISGTETEDACQFCKKSVPIRRILQHYSSHFMQEIKHNCRELMDFSKLKCKVCETKFKQKQSIVLHMGMSHLKVNDILISKGLKPVSQFKKKRKSRKKRLHVKECVEPKVEIKEYADHLDDFNPTVICSICRCNCQDVAELWNHYSKVHYRKPALEDHLSVSNGLICKKCEKSFNDENSLFMHVGVCYSFL